MGNSPEAYDISRKIHKHQSNVQDHDIVAGVKELVNMDPQSPYSPWHVNWRSLQPWFVKQLRRFSNNNPIASEKVSLCQRQQKQDCWRRQKASELSEAPTNKEVWPPRSLDCNPLNYYVCGIAEFDVNNAPHNTKESLIKKIIEVLVNISREEVALACNWFCGPLEWVITINGDFIE